MFPSSIASAALLLQRTRSPLRTACTSTAGRHPGTRPPHTARTRPWRRSPWSPRRIVLASPRLLCTRDRRGTLSSRTAQPHSDASLPRRSVACSRHARRSGPQCTERTRLARSEPGRSPPHTACTPPCRACPRSSQRCSCASERRHPRLSTQQEMSSHRSATCREGARDG